MNGLDLARGYYEDCGKPLLESEFADLLPCLAVGFVGSGSEHYGFDDEVSRDHDFEPGFCIFLPGEELVDRRRAFQLERAYAKLPKEYKGVSRPPISPVGGNRHGVFRTAEFYARAVGSPDARLSLEQWLTLPDYVFAEAVNGVIFFDNYGEVTAIRERLRRMPEDIRRKRIAGNLLIMGQAGQYNLPRCLRHGEPEAVQLACVEFVNAAMKLLFLLRGAYMPYYKWSFHALRELKGTEEAARLLSALLLGGDGKSKGEIIEKIAQLVSDELCEKGYIRSPGTELERLAYSVNDTIRDGEVRNMNIFAAVN